MNDDLIERLAKDLAPVRVKSRRRLALELGATLFVAGAGAFAALGFAAQLPGRLARPDFVLSLVCLVAAIALASSALARYARPGVARPRRLETWLGGALGLAALLLLARFAARSDAESWGPPIERGWRCSVSALAVALAAGIALAVELRRQAPVKLAGAAATLLLATGGLGALVLQAHCSNENPLHQLLWHVLVPLGLLLGAAKYLFQKALKW